MNEGIKNFIEDMQGEFGMRFMLRELSGIQKKKMKIYSWKII